MKSAPLALVAVAGTLALAIVLGGIAMVGFLRELWPWFGSAALCWVVILFWALRRLQALAMRTPGGRLRAEVRGA